MQISRQKIIFFLTALCLFGTGRDISAVTAQDCKDVIPTLNKLFSQRDRWNKNNGFSNGYSAVVEDFVIGDVEAAYMVLYSNDPNKIPPNTNPNLHLANDGFLPGGTSCTYRMNITYLHGGNNNPFQATLIWSYNEEASDSKGSVASGWNRRGKM